MRNFQNNVSIFGNVATDIVVRQGNQLVVSIESLRSLCASSLSALYSYSSHLASWLGDDAWQGPSPITRTPMVGKPRIGMATCFAKATVLKALAVVKQDQRRHEIMCHRAAA